MTQKTDLELAQSHKYRLLDGSLAVNVTTISSLLDIDGKSSAFAGAAVKLTKEGKDHRAEWKAKGELGNRIHSHFEHWLAGEPIDALPDEMGYLDGLEKAMIELEMSPIWTERIVLSNRGYGGRFDLLAEFDNGRIGLIDLKSGRQYAVEHTLQLAAYRYSDGMAVFGMPESPGLLLPDLEPLPPIDFTACLYVAADGSYDLVEYPADEKAFEVFCGLLEAYKWTRTSEIKELVKQSKEKS